MLHIILLVTTLTSSAEAAKRPVLLQSPAVHSVIQGSSVRFQCSMENANVSKLIVTWFKQGSKRQELLTSDSHDNVHRNPGVTARFQPFRDVSNNSYILNITNVQLNDNAVYVCSVQGSIYGAGTQLNVTTSATRSVDTLPTLDCEPTPLSGNTQVLEKPKKSRTTQQVACNSPNDGITVISNPNPTYYSFEAKCGSNSRMQRTEAVPGKCRRDREVEKQQQEVMKCDTDEEIYANYSQINHHPNKKESSELQAESNATYANFDPRY
ncbi:uncharacterized protein LOC122552556 isoform X3 [Chiloscyllium plagiosum]|uniref:uncharacterized protein LOC122552556 isoform X3 n=1 Tax=Chiloscyllium plagiosum TaxID=36176 RepID=UPI001CB8671E|nr:uncharacterized protein LOC122552556 isoform X3 [Chiloscyllium plagiosum]